ncbi:MAG TPA: tetratricopeptide repeat protein [Planctomycetaceae bacterium]|nr:tetratricopeptide repeat protein [Planctomycetaceae bacterium]
MLASGQPAAARAWFERAQSLSERPAEHLELARCCRRLRDFPAVETHLRRALATGAPQREVERQEWLTLAALGQYRAMATHWAELFEDPGDDGREICEAYVTSALSRFRLSDAFQVLSAWERDFPRDPQPHFVRGLIYETSLNFEAASKSYERALELDSTRTDARLKLARCLLERLQTEEAVRQLQLCLQADPDSAGAATLLARARMKLGDYESARNLLERQLARDSQRVDARQMLGEIELEANHPQAAVEYLAPAVALQPENHELRYTYAQALERSGHKQEAKAHFEFVKEAQQALARLLPQTQELLRRPDDVALRFEIASATWRYKSREDGAKWLQSVLEYDPQHAGAKALLAEHVQLLARSARAATDVASAPESTP